MSFPCHTIYKGNRLIYAYIWLSSRSHLSRIFPFPFSPREIIYIFRFRCLIWVFIHLHLLLQTVTRLFCFCTKLSYLLNWKYIMTFRNIKLILGVCVMRLFWFEFFFLLPLISFFFESKPALALAYFRRVKALFLKTTQIKMEFRVEKG